MICETSWTAHDGDHPRNAIYIAAIMIRLQVTQQHNFNCLCNRAQAQDTTNKHDLIRFYAGQHQPTIIAAIWINLSTTPRAGYDLNLAASIAKWPICCPADKAHSAKNRRGKQNMKNIRTYTNAINAGYILADTTLQRGYVSVKQAAQDAPIHVAGGNRRGQLYVLLHNPSSTQYCYRQYLRQA